MPSEEQVSERMRVQRDAAIERDHGKPMQAEAFSTKVVGVSFTPHYPDNLLELSRVANPPRVPAPEFSYGDQAQLRIDMERAEAELRRAGWEPLAAVLVRNPDNEYAANAIEVHVPALGQEMGFIGHLTRPIAARMAPEIDGGTPWAATIESVLIDPDYMDRPGIAIKCVRAPEQETS